jgi:hypothetical protein
MILPSHDRRSRILVEAVDSTAFLAPFAVLMALSNVRPFTGDTGLDHSRAAHAVLVVSLLSANGMQRMLGLKD